MPVSEQTYLRVALEDPEGQWELHCGRLVEKPGMTFEHNHLMNELAFMLRGQLDSSRYYVHVNSSRARRSSERYYIPDIVVIPVELTLPLRGRKDRVELYRDPLPLVVEVWSPSTGEYDVDEKLPEYRKRGDAEIWRIHPYELTLTAWRRQPDGSYVETLHTTGTVSLVALPGIVIDLDTLFA
ncbi:MAG: Uma2 family endonuclease [Chloroflexi bacterium]|nr:Uma2 family endonuclease [Chloroflexota bacterium]